MRLPGIGLLIGLAAGTVHFYVLSRFTAGITSGCFTVRTAALGILQFLIPMAVLLLCALLLRDALVWTAIGMASMLIICAAGKTVLARRGKGYDSCDD